MLGVRESVLLADGNGRSDLLEGGEQAVEFGRPPRVLDHDDVAASLALDGHADVGRRSLTVHSECTVIGDDQSVARTQATKVERGLRRYADSHLIGDLGQQLIYHLIGHRGSSRRSLHYHAPSLVWTIRFK